MALSNFLIRPPTEAQQSQPVGQRRAASATAPGGPSFAAVMQGQARQAEDGAQSQQIAHNQGAQASAAAGMPVNFTSGQTPSRNMVLAGRSPSDLMRTQVFNKAQTDLRQTQAIEGLMQSVSGGGSTLDLARSMGTARHLRSMTSAIGDKMSGLSVSDFIHSRTQGQSKPRQTRSKASAEDMEMGKLSAQFESGRDGVAAVGYDRNGGTSYGKYQVSSRAGSLGDFLDFLDNEAPDLSKRLRASGPGNTGGRKGAMPDTWRAIASEQPERFEDLQEAYVRESHYKPAVEAIAQRTSLDADKLSTAMREVIWSTAVQHGPTGAARIFARADDMSGSPNDPGYERKLISNVYKVRSGQFGSSTSEVQAAVQNRFRQERTLALNLLDDGHKSNLA
ncbi:MAG: hypothetical protein QM579_10820 [Desulfovibrio sp.]|uniref:VgrG-related protein n=1 Tax=Desulfovibrio sp. TaxID=885 RepID=UPI0039E6F4BC